MTINLTGEALLTTRAAYYGLINHVDDQINRLLHLTRAIDEKTGDNTILIFTSDHGEMPGDHYMWHKVRAYQAAARVPLLIQGPADLGFTAGTTVTQPATHADIMPTILDLAGIDIPDSVDGKSLVPWLKGDDSTLRDYVHIEHAPRHQAVTDGNEKYIWLVQTGEEQFFDLTKDPGECRNLIGEPDYTERIRLWRARLINALRDRRKVLSAAINCCQAGHTLLLFNISNSDIITSDHHCLFFSFYKTLDKMNRCQYIKLR